jgi:hypothetical protein
LLGFLPQMATQFPGPSTKWEGGMTCSQFRISVWWQKRWNRAQGHGHTLVLTFVFIVTGCWSRQLGAPQCHLGQVLTSCLRSFQKMNRATYCIFYWPVAFIWHSYSLKIWKESTQALPLGS